MNIINMDKLFIKVNKKTILIWSLIMFLVIFIYMILYPTVNDMAQIKMDLLPSELLEIFNLSDISLLSDYNEYYKMVYAIMVIPISIFSINLFTFSLLNEEKNKTINYLSNLSVSRKDIFISKVLSTYIALFLVIIACLFSSLLCGYISGGNTFNAIEIINITISYSLCPIFLVSVSAFACGFSYKLGKSIAYGYLFISYILGYLGNLINSNILINLSVYNVFNSSYEYYMEFAIAYTIIFIILFNLGYKYYSKRDLHT